MATGVGIDPARIALRPEERTIAVGAAIWKTDDPAVHFESETDPPLLAVRKSVINDDERVFPRKFQRVCKIHPVLFEVAATFGFVPFEFHETTD